MHRTNRHSATVFPQRVMATAIAIIMCVATCVFSAEAQINTDQVLRVGKNALYFEDYMLSIQYFNRVIEAKPYLAQPYFFRAIAKLNLDDYQGAEEDADMAIERNPFITDAYEVRGVARQNLGKHIEAIADYDEALKMIPNNRGIMFNKALAQEDSGDLDGATATFNRLIEVYPGYDNAYIGRAKVELAKGDTVAANEDLTKAISLNKNSANAYLMRADIAIRSNRDYQSALNDMDEAIKLQPRVAGYFINRAFLRYNLDDYFGAMADYDYALTLDPLNQIAYFNRGLLRAEVSDNDRALEDFTRVLQIDPNDVRARYNRAIIYREKRDFKNALSDLDRVVEAFPEFSAPVFARFEIYDMMGDKRNAMKQYDMAMALSKAEFQKYERSPKSADTADQEDVPPGADSTNQKSGNGPESSTDPSEIFANRFTTLLTIDNEINDEREFNNKSIRGKVQDRNVTITIEPDFVAAYYSSPTELAPSTYYMQEIDRLNATRQLRFMLQITNHQPELDDESLIQRHFQSIDYYNSWLATHTPRAIDYFARAMDQFTLHNYEGAIEDFDRAVALTSDFALAYFMRAVARSQYESPISTDGQTQTTAAPLNPGKIRLSMILDDYDKFIELSPRSPFAHFNKGNIYVNSGDLTSALSAYSRAIELKPDFGEAYYNRGYVYFKLGNREAGTADLSRAGELGILPSYNLLKRMNR